MNTTHHKHSFYPSNDDTMEVFVNEPCRRRNLLLTLLLLLVLVRADAFSAQQLSSLTVRELKELVKENSERGVLSKLKRKQDLVDYLVSRQGAPNNGQTITPVNGERTPPHPRLVRMPNKPMSPRDAQANQVLSRYPFVREVSDETDILLQRSACHPVTKNLPNTDMDVCFVGTASCTPSVTRGVSCTAVRLNWRTQPGTWLFDVGEGTQLQIQKTSSVRPSKISKIFLTHAHGDHTFGLPGLLCLMGQDRERSEQPIDIYGPEGLRMWLRVAIRYSVSRIVPRYRVHEIKDIPMAPAWEFNPRKRRYVYARHGDRAWTRKGLAGEDPVNWISQANQQSLQPSAIYGEVEGGTDIYPEMNHPQSVNGAPVWEVVDEEDVKVYAAPMSHGVPCLGYVINEASRAGRLRNEFVEPIVRRNIDQLKEAGFRIPMKAMAVIKNLAAGSSFTFPDGTVVNQEEAVEPPREGRKIVILGDTCDATAIAKLAMNPDVVVHECTNAFLQGFDKDTSIEKVTQDAILHGHSTPSIAGAFGKAVKARYLILNHFSARYKGDCTIDSLGTMTRIENQAMKASSLNSTRVAAAWDMMVLPVPPR